MLTVLSAEFATTARFSAGSIAMADGLWPTLMVELAEDGNDAGSTAKFTAEMGGLGGTTSLFWMTIGYRPGTLGACMVTFITRVVPPRLKPTGCALKDAEVHGEKYPPVRITPTFAVLTTALSGDAATT